MYFPNLVNVTHSCSYQFIVNVDNGCEWRELIKNVCSYQVLLIAIKTKDMDKDRRIIFLGFHID